MKTLVLSVALCLFTLPALSADAVKPTCKGGKCSVERVHKSCGPLGCHEVKVSKTNCGCRGLGGCPCGKSCDCKTERTVKVKSRYPVLYRVLHPRTW